MERRIVLCSWLMTIIIASVCYSQQELYVEQLQSIDAGKNSIDFCAVSLKANLIGILSSEGGVKVYDIPSLKEKMILTSIPVGVNMLSFSGSGQTLALGAADGKVYLFNITAPNDIKEISLHSLGITSMVFQGENWIFSAGFDKKVLMTDVVNNVVMGSLPDFQEEVTAMAVHPSAKYFAVGLSTGTVQVYAVSRLELQNTFIDSKDKISTICYSADGKFLAAGAVDGNVYLWDAQTGALKLKYNQKGLIGSVSFDPKSRWLISTADSTLKFYDMTALSAVKTMFEHDATITYAGFLNDETLLTSTSRGKLKSWKVASASPDTANPGIILDYAVDSTTIAKVFGREYEVCGVVFDDSELKEATFNGKPLVLSTLTSKDTVSIPAGMKAVKRFSTVFKLDSIGLIPFEIKVTDNAKHSVSKSGFIQRLTKDQAVEVENPLNNSETESMSVPVKFRTWFDVDSYSISVNMVDFVNSQVPEFRTAGDVIADTVPLVAAGYNQIQLSITCKTGEKFSKTIGINRKTSVLGAMPFVAAGAKKARVADSGPQQWAVVVGVSEYMNSGIPSLKYADKDAEALANFLRRPEGGGYDSDHMRVLLNKDATLANIKEALINFLNQAIDMDLVMIYFAGHGAPDPARPQNMYLLMHDSDPASLGTSAFPMWEIQTVLARYISAKRVIVFTDACHSGGISVNFTTRGLGKSEPNLVNQYLEDLSKTKEGIVIFTASAAGELSQEFPEFSHGVFTYYLLKGLEGNADYNNDYTVTINELMQYVEEQVKRKTHGAQNPTRSQTEYDKEMTISLIPH
jgi:WD40 repeat protein